jgi:hypothetical protein
LRQVRVQFYFQRLVDEVVAEVLCFFHFVEGLRREVCLLAEYCAASDQPLERTVLIYAFRSLPAIFQPHIHVFSSTVGALVWRHVALVWRQTQA